MPRSSVSPSQRLIALIREHPGLNAKQLTAVGWEYRVHGSLRDAERARTIEWRPGWYVRNTQYEEDRT